MEPYDLEYHKALNRSHILPNFLEGAKSGIYSQFIADIVISLLLFNEAIVIEDIELSGIAKYYAAVASGITVSVLSIYLDPFAVVIFSTVAYSVVFNLVDSDINGEEFDITPREIAFDAIVSILILYSFDETAHNQYYRYQEKRHCIEPIHQRKDRSNAQTIFLIVLVNTYNYLKIISDQQENSTPNTEC